MADRQLATVLQFLHQAASPEAVAAFTDGELLESFLVRRDGEAFAALLRRHGPLVYAVCRRVLGRLEDVEDAFQATFLILARRARSIVRRDSVGSWLHGVARRVAVRARADAARRRECEGKVVPPAPADAFEEAARRDLGGLLDEEVGRLPRRCREPFVLCYLQGRTNEEAARLLGCPKGTVLSRLARARELLRARLTRRGLGLSATLVTTVIAPTAPACVPAALAMTTTEAALGSAVGKGAAAGPAAALAEGVIAAMKATQISWTAAVLLAVGVVAGGVGWTRYRAGGAEPPARRAEKPRDAEPAAAPAKEDDRATAERERRVRLDKAVAEVREQEVELQELERRWLVERLESQRSLLELESRLEKIRREQGGKLDRVRTEREALDAHIRKTRELRADPEPNTKFAEQLARWQRDLDRLTEEADKHSAELLDARLRVLQAREELALLERRQASQRARLQMRVDAADERVRQLQGDAATAESPERRLAGLERKLDQLIREIAELRRELRRP